MKKSLENAIAHIVPALKKAATNTDIINAVNTYCDFAGITDSLFKLDLAVGVAKAL